MLYSGPIQLDEREENNYISFNVYENRTFTRFYVETSTMTLTLEQLSTPTETHPVTVGTYSQSFAKTLSEGMYRVKFKDGSTVNQGNQALMAPKSYLTIAYAQESVERLY
jgi:hypothetical protein